MRTYDATTRKFEKEEINSIGMARIYGFMAIALLVTGLIAFGLPRLLVALNWGDIYLPLLIGSVIAMLPCMIIIQIKSFNGNSKAVPICFAIYTIAMGIFLSSLLLEIDIQTTFLAFGITGGLFGIMAIIGLTTKKSMNGLWPIVFCGMLGAIILTVVNIFMKSTVAMWIAEFVMFGVILLMTAIDMNNIRRIALSKNVTNNIALYCAFNLYVDFIYIFIRVVYFLMIISSRR